MDGRITLPVIGAMGGESGEFLLGLATFENVAHIELSEIQVGNHMKNKDKDCVWVCGCVSV